MAPPASVEELWTVAQLGSMPPLEQMKAYALREVVQSLDVHIPNSRKGKVPYQWIADRVQVYTGDRTVQRPERDAVRGRVMACIHHLGPMLSYNAMTLHPGRSRLPVQAHAPTPYPF